MVCLRSNQHIWLSLRRCCSTSSMVMPSGNLSLHASGSWLLACLSWQMEAALHVESHGGACILYLNLVWECECVWESVCVCVCACVGVHGGCMWVCVCACVGVHGACMWVCVSVCLCGCAWCMHVSMCVCVQAYGNWMLRNRSVAPFVYNNLQKCWSYGNQ